jgi:NAD(P)-dependent dehydrogenase (short-subunit alcohol dehydrogenase family)
MSGQFDGKIALVTGAGSGIGRTTALAFARDRAKVVVADVNADGGEATVSRIKDSGGEALFVSTDVSTAAEVEALVAGALTVYGRLDYAHNNAGIHEPEGPIAETPKEMWDRVIAINLTGVWLGMKYEIPAILESAGGAIVNTASAAGLIEAPSNGAYVASKHGVVGLTKVAALDYSAQGVRVNCVCPGVIRTPMVGGGNLDPEAESRFVSAHPIRRLGTAEEVAEAVIWLCSDAASFVTGHAMSVDGGYVIR